MNNNTGSRETAVNQQVSQLEMALENHAKVIAELVDRLTPILKPKSSPSEVEKGGTLQESNLCSLAETIRRHKQSVDFASGSIQTILQDLEI
jgi:hypothetical protein